jgi:hypothetical protein
VLGFIRIFAEMGREVNYDVVGTHAGGIEGAKNVEVRSSRKIFRIEKATDVRTEITAAACD